MSDARTTLLTSWGEHEVSHEGGFTVTRITSGEPHTWAIFNAVLDRYNAIAERPRPSEEDLHHLLGQKVTLVNHGENMMGGALIGAIEGTLFPSTRGLGILPKRARTKGFRVQNVIDVLPGYATADAQALIDKVRSQLPELRPITQERLNELPPDLSDDGMLDLCAFGTHRLPDSEQADALVLFGAYMSEDDILDRGVVLVRPEHGVSEHGSMYGQQLLRGRFGEVVGYKPISFSEGLELCDLDFDEAYARVVPSI